MIERITIGGIIKTSIVTAFTIAAALIWKDVITDSLDILFPGEQLFYKFIAAIVATIIVIFAIYFVLKTEYEAEHIMNVMKKMNRKRRKEIIKKIREEEVRQEKKKLEEEKKKIELQAKKLKK
jgi:uncharacterized membrane protein YgaE (UPF0421/DUF939 family)